MPHTFTLCNRHASYISWQANQAINWLSFHINIIWQMHNICFIWAHYIDPLIKSCTVCHILLHCAIGMLHTYPDRLIKQLIGCPFISTSYDKCTIYTSTHFSIMPLHSAIRNGLIWLSKALCHWVWQDADILPEFGLSWWIFKSVYDKKRVTLKVLSVHCSG